MENPIHHLIPTTNVTIIKAKRKTDAKQIKSFMMKNKEIQIEHLHIQPRNPYSHPHKKCHHPDPNEVMHHQANQERRQIAPNLPKKYEVLSGSIMIIGMTPIVIKSVM